jgi:hypothetical protein
MFPTDISPAVFPIPIVVGAADRMMTQGDIQFEVPGLSRNRPDAPMFKSVALNRHIMVMTAGDAGFQTEAVEYLWRATENSRGNTTGGWSYFPVHTVAQKYLEFCDSRRRRATDSILAPYGLNAETFAEKQQQLSQDFVRWVLNEVEATRREIGDPIIICGLDITGAHVYYCDGVNSSPSDSIGFCCIGSGGKHARSEFILGNHSRFDRLEHTLLLAYTAKRRAEKAPGVGRETDMFVIEPRGRRFLNYAELQSLERIYLKMQRSQDAAFRKAKEETARYVAQIIAAEATAAPAVLPDANQPPQAPIETSSSGDQT